MVLVKINGAFLEHHLMFLSLVCIISNSFLVCGSIPEQKYVFHHPVGACLLLLVVSTKQVKCANIAWSDNTGSLPCHAFPPPLKSVLYRVSSSCACAQKMANASSR
jgi:hypothetical protein